MFFSKIAPIALILFLFFLFGCIQQEPSGQAIGFFDATIDNSHASTTYSTNTATSKSYDGDLNTVWSTDALSSAPTASNPQWIAWDLGSNQGVKRITLTAPNYVHLGYFHYFPKSFYLQLVNESHYSDGNTYYVWSSPVCSQAEYNIGQGETFECNITEYNARYVVLFITDAWQVQNIPGLQGKYVSQVAESDIDRSSVIGAKFNIKPQVEVSADMARITWTTTDSTTTGVNYRWNTLDHPVSDTYESNSTLTTSHSITLRDLVAGQNYKFIATSCDSTGYCNSQSLSEEGSFNTLLGFLDASSCNISLTSAMTAGQTYSATVSFTNSGNIVWRNPYFYLKNHNSNFSPTTINFSSGEEIWPQSSKDFSFTVTAPSTAGTYDANFQMSYYYIGRNGQVHEAFGESCKKTVTVSAPTNDVWIAVNSTTVKDVNAGATLPVTVTVYNTNTSSASYTINYSYTLPNCSSNCNKTGTVSGNVAANSNQDQTLSISAETHGSYNVTASLSGIDSGKNFNTENDSTSFTFNALLPKPFNLTATGQQGQTSLSWSAVTAPSGYAFSNYNIYRSTSIDGTYSELETTSSTSYEDTTASSGTTYYYKVSALYSKNSTIYESPFSDIKSSASYSDFPTVQDFALTSGDKNILLSWTAPNLSGTGLTLQGYKIYGALFESPKSDFALIASPASSSTSYESTGLENGTRYYYFIDSLYGGSNVGSSSVLNSVPSSSNDSLCPAIGSVQSSFVAGKTYDLNISMKNTGDNSWSAGISPSNAYELSLQIFGNTFEKTVSGTVAKNQWHDFIISIDVPSYASYPRNLDSNWQMKIGDAEFGALCSQTMTVNTPYAPPKGLTAVEGDSQVSLFWLLPDEEDKGLTDIASFEVFRSLTSTGTFSNIAEVENNVSDLNYKDSSVSNDQNYYYKVRAVYADNEKSDYSETVSATPSIEAGNAPNSFCQANTIPSSLDAGETKSVSVTLKNVGAVDWTEEDFELEIKGFINRTESFTGTIALNESKEFSFSITAPNASGTYDLNWYMKRNGTQFGPTCSDSFTVSVVEAECSEDSDCFSDEVCNSSNTCVELNCPTGYTVSNHTCVAECSGTTCGGTCYTEAGACCSGEWNPGFSQSQCSTIEEIIDLQDLLDEREDEEAQAYLQEALSFLAQGKLQDARNAADEGIDTWNKNSGFGIDPLIIAIIVIVAVAGIGAFLFIKKRKGSGEEKGFEKIKEQTFGKKETEETVNESSEMEEIKKTLRESLEEEGQEVEDTQGFK